VFEDMDLKREIFERLDGVAAEHAVLATNTSTLDVDRIAQATDRPGAVVGMHFFSPANVMKLLEVVRGEATSDQALVTAVRLGKKMGKVPVVVGVCDGFVGNRMFHVYVHEASTLIEEGALPQDVDRVMTDFGFKMGPFAVQDLAGLDVGYRIRNQQAVARGVDPDGRERTIADKIVERDRLGQKTNAGFYRYDDGSRTPVPDPEITYELAAQLDAQGLGRVPGGSLYPALLRLEGQGLLASEWRAGDGGPGRKYYRLTAEGRATLDADVRRWDAFASAVGGVLATARRRGPR
jgi:3-hydroxyacyl-CoA dehydrogenase